MMFYISKQGQQLGPWSEVEILKNLQNGYVSWSDFLYDESSKEWVMLMDYPGFETAIKDLLSKPAKPIENSLSPALIQDEKEWYILKSENKYGPFTSFEVVRMLQEKSLYEYDFVWNPKLGQQWLKIAEVNEFGLEKIRELHGSKDKELKDVFLRRRFARKSYGASLLVHNSKSVWKGHSIEISSGGAGVIVENPDFQTGQTLFLHFKVGDGVPPFNAICTIVSKHEDSKDGRKTKYGVKFTSISQDVQQAIKLYTEHDPNKGAA